MAQSLPIIDGDLLAHTEALASRSGYSWRKESIGHMDRVDPVFPNGSTLYELGEGQAFTFRLIDIACGDYRDVTVGPGSVVEHREVIPTLDRIYRIYDPSTTTSYLLANT